MGENMLKKWIKNTEGLPKTRAEADAMMRAGYEPVDALGIDELETFATNGKNKVYIAIYAKALLEARKNGNYNKINRFRHEIGMDSLP